MVGKVHHCNQHHNLLIKEMIIKFPSFKISTYAQSIKISTYVKSFKISTYAQCLQGGRCDAAYSQRPPKGKILSHGQW